MKHVSGNGYKLGIINYIYNLADYLAISVMRTLVLQGYGISIKVEKGKLVISQGKNRITGKQEVIEITDNTKFDKIIIEGNSGWISFHALDLLSYLGINVVMVDRKGKLYATFNQIKGDTEPTIRQQQYDCFRKENSLDYLRKWIVTERINSQIQLLRERLMVDKKLDRHIVENTIADIEKRLDSIKTVNIQKLRGIEGYISNRYYHIFPKLINRELGFETRTNRNTGIPKDASDVINILLNYGFSILQAEVSKQLNSMGLDCYVGFYHKNHPNTVPLVYDIMETSRHLIERAVIEIADTIDKNKDYRYFYFDNSYPNSSKGVVVPPITYLRVSHDLKKRFVFHLTTVFNRKRYYKTPKNTRMGFVPEHGYQKLEEITIMKMKCVELRNYILSSTKVANQQVLLSSKSL